MDIIDIALHNMEGFYEESLCIRAAGFFTPGCEVVTDNDEVIDYFRDIDEFIEIWG